MRLRGRVLSIAGSDCSGGAGIQADIKTIAALGGYAATAITAITVQDTERVHAVHPVAPALVAAQVACVLADPGIDAIKTGMMVNAATIAAVMEVLTHTTSVVPLVVDPVMTATVGGALLGADALTAMRRLCAAATIVTPNLPEAMRLLDRDIATLSDTRAAAGTLRDAGAGAVLIKGGHGAGDTLVDVLLTADGFTEFAHPRSASRHTHGTGCTLAAAIATGLAQGAPLAAAVADAIACVQAAIRSAPGFGTGRGPLNHAALWNGNATAGGGPRD